MISLIDMRKDKEKATFLRKSGKSYQEIETEMGVPKSTLSDWFRGQNWSKELSIKLCKMAKLAHTVRIKELNRIRGNNLKKLYQQAENEAAEEFDLLKYHPLFIAGLMIYWGEGNKVSKSRCWIANTEPLMIKLFLQFLKNICGFKQSRIKAWILIYPDLDERLCRSFWSRKTGLSSDNFHKSALVKGTHKSKRISFGVCSVGVSSAYLKCKILKWIQLLANDLVKENYIADIV